ncbi:MAG: 50S ribosomal protein L2 [Deltaproteobacteria bacterium]|nr:50S ribosomal protein L2 [Deltaproteobacteria bacterium]
MVKRFRPTSHGIRAKTVSDFAEITRDFPEKKLTLAAAATSGRNCHGRITSRFMGGGHRRRYRIIDFKRDKIDIPANVFSIEYDPYRSARIALLVYADGEKRYIVAPDGLKVGQKVLSSNKATEIEVGYALPLSEIPVGSGVYNVEIKPGAGGKIARSAGTQVRLMARDGDYASVRMPSGEIRKILATCRATIGTVGNSDHENLVIGKAGRTRWLGRRGHVRGTVMNPVDHPHGGGHGRDHGGRHPVSPWGLPTKGYKTRNNKRTNKFIIKGRKKKNI